jgi:uncharacterized protein YmfQ (DUF2313 family)
VAKHGVPTGFWLDSLPDGMATLPRAVLPVALNTHQHQHRVAGPLIVKTRVAHASLGITRDSVVRNMEQLTAQWERVAGLQKGVYAEVCSCLPRRAFVCVCFAFCGCHSLKL